MGDAVQFRKLSLFLIVATLSVAAVSAAQVNISACQEINSSVANPGDTIVLDQDIVGADQYYDMDKSPFFIDFTYYACLNVRVQNITVDCEGHSITNDYTPTSGDATLGILVNQGGNLTVRGCNINEYLVGVSPMEPSILSFAYGSYGYPHANPEALVIENNTVHTNGTSVGNSGSGVAGAFAGTYFEATNNTHTSEQTDKSVTSFFVYDDALIVDNVMNISNEPTSSGVGLYGSDTNVTMYGNEVYASIGVLALNDTSPEALIYNNYFDVDIPGALDGVAGSLAGVLMNTTQSVGTNIVGGSAIGGNYYTNFSSNCTDAAPQDGICDSVYEWNAQVEINESADQITVLEGYNMTDELSLAFVPPTISNCTTLNSGVVDAGETVYLTQNITLNGSTATGTCFYIDQQNITLDCQGNQINNTNAGKDETLSYVNTGADGFVMKNCVYDHNIVDSSNGYNLNSIYANATYQNVTFIDLWALGTLRVFNVRDGGNLSVQNSVITFVGKSGQSETYRRGVVSSFDNGGDYVEVVDSVVNVSGNNGVGSVSSSGFAYGSVLKFFTSTTGVIRNTTVKNFTSVFFTDKAGSDFIISGNNITQRYGDDPLWSFWNSYNNPPDIVFEGNVVHRGSIIGGDGYFTRQFQDSPHKIVGNSFLNGSVILPHPGDFFCVATLGVFYNNYVAGQMNATNTIGDNGPACVYGWQLNVTPRYQDEFGNDRPYPLTGSLVAGNYYANKSCTDADQNGFCDSPVQVSPFKPSGGEVSNNTGAVDGYPLVNTTVFAYDECPRSVSTPGSYALLGPTNVSVAPYNDECMIINGDGTRVFGFGSNWSFNGSGSAYMIRVNANDVLVEDIVTDGFKNTVVNQQYGPDESNITVRDVVGGWIAFTDNFNTGFYNTHVYDSSVSTVWAQNVYDSEISTFYSSPTNSTLSNITSAGKLQVRGDFTVANSTLSNEYPIWFRYGSAGPNSVIYNCNFSNGNLANFSNDGFPGIRCTSDCSQLSLSVDPYLGENIVGGRYIAGNYFNNVSEGCFDGNADGLCDDPIEGKILNATNALRLQRDRIASMTLNEPVNDGVARFNVTANATLNQHGRLYVFNETTRVEDDQYAVTVGNITPANRSYVFRAQGDRISDIILPGVNATNISLYFATNGRDSHPVDDRGDIFVEDWLVEKADENLSTAQLWVTRPEDNGPGDFGVNYTNTIDVVKDEWYIMVVDELHGSTDFELYDGSETIIQWDQNASGWFGECGVGDSCRVSDIQIGYQDDAYIVQNSTGIVDIVLPTSTQNLTFIARDYSQVGESGDGETYVFNVSNLGFVDVLQADKDGYWLLNDEQPFVEFNITSLDGYGSITVNLSLRNETTTISSNTSFSNAKTSWNTTYVQTPAQNQYALFNLSIEDEYFTTTKEIGVNFSYMTVPNVTYPTAGLSFYDVFNVTYDLPANGLMPANEGRMSGQISYDNGSTWQDVMPLIVNKTFDDKRRPGLNNTICQYVSEGSAKEALMYVKQDAYIEEFAFIRNTGVDEVEVYKMRTTNISDPRTLYATFNGSEVESTKLQSGIYDQFVGIVYPNMTFEGGYYYSMKPYSETLGYGRVEVQSNATNRCSLDENQSVYFWGTPYGAEVDRPAGQSWRPVGYIQARAYGLSGVEIDPLVTANQSDEVKIRVAGVDEATTTNYSESDVFAIDFDPKMENEVCAALTYPNEDDLPQPAEIPVNFTVFAPLGFNNTAIEVNLTFNNITTTVNEPGCSYVNVSSQRRNYSCNLTMNYWYDAGDYSLVVDYTTGVNRGIETASGLCTYGQLVAFERETDIVTFPDAGPGVVDSQGDRPVTMRNTGNAPLDLKLTAYDLVGQQNPAETLAAENFKAGLNLTGAVMLEHGVQKNLSASVQNAEGAEESILLWLSMPSDQSIQDYYADTSWTILGELLVTP